MNNYGDNIRLNIFGQSHSPAIGMTLEGIPAGKEIDMERLKDFMARRAPGQNAYSTARKEKDHPEFICGLVGNTTCGTPITALIHNSDTRSKDYEQLRFIPRPGHADYTAHIKYGGHQDYAGGGHFSGRLTAPLCIAGGILLQLLEDEGISISAVIKSIGGISGDGGPEPTEEMKALIAEKKAEGDSVGGIIECYIEGIPAGLGDPMFDGMENLISRTIFAIPAVKGIEFGAGFSVAEMTGSQNNDPFYYENGIVKTKTNNAGGILGGITNGMPVTFRVAVKPTPSIAAIQKSVDLSKGEDAEVAVSGRHDPCIVPRAVPCVEAATALAVYDALLGRKKEL